MKTVYLKPTTLNFNIQMQSILMGSNDYANPEDGTNGGKPSTEKLV